MKNSYSNFALDFNECNLNNAGCEHVCNNTAGSFNCDCRAGFKLKPDQLGCEGRYHRMYTVAPMRGREKLWGLSARKKRGDSYDGRFRIK